MTDRIRIICSNCRQTFSERANRLKPGYQVQCVHCSRLITFDSSSEEPNIRRPLKAAREFRLAAEEALALARLAAQAPNPHFSRCLIECCGGLTSTVPQPTAVIWA